MSGELKFDLCVKYKLCSFKYAISNVISQIAQRPARLKWRTSQLQLDRVRHTDDDNNFVPTALSILLHICVEQQLCAVTSKTEDCY